MNTYKNTIRIAIYVHEKHDKHESVVVLSQNLAIANMALGCTVQQIKG